MASITWEGGTLTNVWGTTPAGRFTGWRPVSRGVGPRHALLATGEPRAYNYREQFGMAFDLVDIPNTQMALMSALALHLDNAGKVTVVTDDLASNLYENCALYPDADPPEPELSDAQLLRYSMSFRLIVVGATAPIVCVYG